MAPERAAAIDHLAESYAKLATQLAAIGEYLDHVVALLRAMVVVLIVAGVINLAFVGYNAWQGWQGSHARGRLLRQNESIRRTADEVHSAVTPGEPIYEEGQRRTAAVVEALVDELECRERNALARGPDTPAGQTCLNPGGKP